MCVSPITIVHRDRPDGRKTYLVPCGRCSECIKRKATSWGVRCYRESMESETNHFVTLTYDNDHLPHTSLGHETLDRSACTVFIKRLRSYMWYHYGCTFRFFLSGEYGSNTFRPHYHFIFHGLPKQLTCDEIRNICLQLWRSCSIVDVQIPKNGSSGGFYVGKYCGKTALKRIDAISKEDSEFVRPFKRASVGYGSTFTDKEKEYYLAKSFQDEFGADYRVCLEDTTDFERYVKMLNLTPEMDGYYNFRKSLVRHRSPRKFSKWLDVVTQRYFECHRPYKDGSFANIRFPDYLAKKLYGEDLFKVIKRRVQFLNELRYNVVTDGWSALDSNSWARKKLQDYFKQTRVEDFDCFLALEYQREFVDNDNFLRYWREHDNMISLFANDFF